MLTYCGFWLSFKLILAIAWFELVANGKFLATTLLPIVPAIVNNIWFSLTNDLFNKLILKSLSINLTCDKSIILSSISFTLIYGTPFSKYSILLHNE
jgi:predicted AlkP superfamily pyrophosphatase or phosphodiesterase